MRLTLASVGLFAAANAAAVATPQVSNPDPWQQYKAYCSSSGGGPGWGGFLKIHSAFSKLWASTPAGFCVAADNWACVQCDDVYMYFEPQLYKIPSTCYTPNEFGAVATLFNDVARNGKSDCTIGVKDGLWGYGLVSQNFEVQDRGCLKRC